MRFSVLSPRLSNVSAGFGVLLAALAVPAGGAVAHEGEHAHDGAHATASKAGEVEPPETVPAPAAPPSARGPAAAARTTGQGAWVFRHDAERSALPAGAERFLPGAHGGFAVDWKGERDVYFALKGCGIIRMSADLRSKRIIEVDPFVREGNFHNTTLIYDERGGAYLALPDNERERVYITTTEGRLVKVLSHPRGNPYYDGWGSFVPTDVEQAPDRTVHIVTGYSPGDYVVAADPFTGAWKPLIYGGKGREHGKLGTGHGITWNPRANTLDISDRPHSRVESYDLEGNYQRTLTLPEGSLPCDVDFLEETTVVGCLKGPGGATPAPIYVLDAEGTIVSTVKPKEELGLDLFTHVHNVTWHAVGDGEARKVYLLAQAWNPGGFAVLERVD